MKQKQIDDLYDSYKKTLNKNQIIQYIYFYNSQELKKIHSDLDTRLNFIVEFIEYQLDKILQNYQLLEQKYNDQVPFSFLQYLRGGLRNAFYSYLKSKRLFSLNSLYTPLLENLNIETNTSETYITRSELRIHFWFLLSEKLNHFSVLERIIFKLYYHLELDTSELKYLITHYDYKEIKNLFRKIKKNYLKQLENVKSSRKTLFRDFKTDFKKNHKDFLSKLKKEKRIISLKEIQDFLKINEYNVYKVIKKIEKELSIALSKRKEIQILYYCA